MAAAAVARRARLGAAMEAEVAAATTTYLLVRCAAAHPPSWYTRQGRVWIAPFAYGAQQATAATGDRAPHRSTLSPTPYMDELFSFAHMSIVLLSFFPVVIYLALQRSSAGDGAGAGCHPPLSDDCQAKERAVQAGQALRETRLTWSELDSVEAASSSFGAVASANVFHPAGTRLAYSRTASKRGRPGEEKEYMEKEVEGEEEAEPCPAWEVTCRLEKLLTWWRSDGVGRETRVKAALRREALPAGNKRWRNAEGMSGYTRALVTTVSANDATEPGQREREGGRRGVWDFCMRMAASPEPTERKGRMQESEDGAIQEEELPRGWWLFAGGNARDDDGGTTRDAPYTVNVPPQGDVKHSGGEDNRRGHGRKSGAS